ncbi:hypothetical protein M514_08096 [Trichuris suis]|uniref:Uncharacterized protein n=1 Tax=Trichuris suis TaxID=68888 RepID=A0A085M1F9_9BILA|nr:hypothetical protein M513_08096 [Trichuris suis]KFD73269.1 hypothetical protein M514_08096 [Trichuris suis]
MKRYDALSMQPSRQKAPTYDGHRTSNDGVLVNAFFRSGDVTNFHIVNRELISLAKHVLPRFSCLDHPCALCKQFQAEGGSVGWSSHEQ